MKRVGLIFTVISLITGQIVSPVPVSAAELELITDKADLAESLTTEPAAQIAENQAVESPSKQADSNTQKQSVSVSVELSDPAQDAQDDQDDDSAGDSAEPVSVPLAQTILITKVQVGLEGDTAAEFIELYNPSSETVLLDGWRLQYLGQNHDGSPEPDKLLAAIDDLELAGQGYLLIANHGYLDEIADYVYGTGKNTLAQNGTLRLMHGDELIDMVGWGGADQYLGSPAKAVKYSSIERCTDKQMTVVDSRNNRQDFAAYDWPKHPMIGQLATCLDSVQPPDGNDDDQNPGQGEDEDDPDDQPAVNLCKNLIISEIATNVDRQFVEVYNRSDATIDLKGCQITSAKKPDDAARFGDIELEANQYEVIYLQDTELSLYKTVDDIVYLLSSDGKNEVDSQAYGGLGKDTSWALIDDEWQQTYHLTPYYPNQLELYPPCSPGKERNPLTGRCINIGSSIGDDLVPCLASQERSPETNRCRKVNSVSRQLVPCNDDQYRNPETNRCKLKQSAGDDLKPCAAGQYRNPATNRCKAMATKSSALVPCNPGQERNPATNRCRKIGAETNQLKPCRDGYVRNPETNRCRKDRGALGEVAGYAVEPIADSTQSTIGWWAFGGVALLAAGYGTWEWRHEIARLIRGVTHLGRH